MTNSKTQELEYLLSMEQAELFSMAAGELLSSGLGLQPFDSLSQKVETGRRFLEKSLEDLRETICRSATVQVFLENPQATDKAFLVAALADLIAAKVTGVAPATLATFAVRVGLRSFCSPSS